MVFLSEIHNLYWEVRTLRFDDDDGRADNSQTIEGFITNMLIFRLERCDDFNDMDIFGTKKYLYQSG